MQRKKLISLFVFAVFSMQSHSTAADDGVRRKMLNSTALQDIPGYSLTSVIVELKPGASVPARQHEGFVFVYVISGRVLSQLNQEAMTVYDAGDSWIENPGDRHSVTQNMGDTDGPKLLAVFVAPKGARLTLPSE